MAVDNEELLDIARTLARAEGTLQTLIAFSESGMFGSLFPTETLLAVKTDCYETQMDIFRMIGQNR